MSTPFRTAPSELLQVARKWISSSEAGGRNKHVLPMQRVLRQLRTVTPKPHFVFRSTSTPLLEVPQFSDPLRIEFWRRQTLFNEGLRDVVNYWPGQQGLATFEPWLKDEVAPFARARPIPGRSHRKGLFVPTLIRAAKWGALLAAELRYAELLGEVFEKNAVLLDALFELARPTIDWSKRRQGAKALLASRNQRAFSTPALGFEQQERFLDEAALCLASLLLPAEAAVGPLYEQWVRTEQADLHRTGPAPKNRISLVASTEPGAWATEGALGPFGLDLYLSSNVSAVPQMLREWVAVVTEQVTFSPHAVRAVMEASALRPEVDVWYSDHDLLQADGRRTCPSFKPEWSPDLFLEENYVGGVVFMKRAVFQTLPHATPVSPKALSSWLLAEQGNLRIGRISEVLWHRQGPANTEAHRQAVSEHLARTAPEVRVSHENGLNRVQYPVRPHRLSIVVPFKDKPELLDQLIESLCAHEKRDFELILVSNRSQNPATFQTLARFTDPRIMLREWNEPFNFQTLNNHAVRQWATGDVLLFLNNDIEWRGPHILDELVSQAQRPEVGAVGALLRYPNGTVQHAGVTVGLAGMAAHPFAGADPDAPYTPFGRPASTRNLLAVTGACLAMRRSVFDEVGGFDERFQVATGDVDLCLRIYQKGYRILHTPWVQLVHHESATRTNQLVEIDAWEGYDALFGYLRSGDPYYNPNLTVLSLDCMPRLDNRPAELLARQMLAYKLPSSALLA